MQTCLLVEHTAEENAECDILLKLSQNPRDEEQTDVSSAMGFFFFAES